jgi:protein kinase-like protein
LNEQTHLPIGAVFHGYRIEALIGQGGMGVVYRAFDLRLKRTVALKLMASDLGLDARFRERFSRESELAMSLEHPNVVPIHDAGEIDGRLYLAMRDVEGADLRALLRAEGPLGVARAVAICAQIAAAVDAAHAKGLVHRDVKPSNVLLDSSEHVYLADFGLTRRFDEEGVAPGESRSLGTPAYLAPEQIEGGPVDGRVDVYSLACLLYECLTAEPPFASGSRLGVAWAHLEEDPPSASAHKVDLPGAIDAVIAKGMAKDPRDRYSTCAELISAARQALGVSDSQLNRRRTLVLVAVAASLVTFAALLAAVLLTRGDSAAAGSSPVVRGNSLVRIDPRTNSIARVIGVGGNPSSAAVGGRSVWVYSNEKRTVSEIDSATNAVRRTIAVSTYPADVDFLSGPVIAADDRGAWLVGFELDTGRNLLTRILAGVRDPVEYRLPQAPTAVAVGAGVVWVLTRDERGNVVLGVDPQSGAVTSTTRLPTFEATSLGVGEGGVWVASSTGADFYRIDTRSAKVTGTRDLGNCAGPPVVGFGAVWMCVCNPGSSMLRINPRTLRNSLSQNSVPAQNGHFVTGHGSLWWADIPSGAVMRWSPVSGKLIRTIRVTPTTPIPDGRGLISTAIAVGADSIWVTVGQD